MADKKPFILGVITARGGSKGIPGKNIKLLGDKPLIAYTIAAAKKSTLLSHFIVSTDDEEIARVCRKCEADVPFIRPNELAQDSTPHVPVMQHAVREMESKFARKFDIAVILQPTSPFRIPEDIDHTIETLLESDADSAVSVCEIDSNAHPIKAKRLDGNRVLPFCVEETEVRRRQDLPKAFKRSGAVYAVKRGLLMDEGRLYGNVVVGYSVPVERSIDIDGPRDWVVAEFMLKELKKKGYEL